MSSKKRDPSGATEMLLLSLLSQKPMYGYEMVLTMREQSNHVFDLKAGTLYPLLHDLEQKGLVVSWDGAANGRVRRYYALSPAGRDALRDQVKQWKAYAAGVRRVLKKGGAESGA